MLGKPKKNLDIGMNGSHPVLSDEDLEIITSFCKIFQDSKGRIDIEKMIQNFNNYCSGDRGILIMGDDNVKASD